ncbi:2-C-methyl-D-erythritol 4-phosphate cytidylyltransferase, chloroplastic-like [Cicer arietinum]|uniref:2-C-methyl-D-erythritol 4-phosphate cytidylyltransferase, chloroplastic-like n=1 Tax=Cicer arietinum TaxID=3827 RepID=UPI003CC5177E
MLSNLPFQNCHLTPPLASGHAVGSTSSSFEQESESVVKQRSVSVVLLAGGKGKRMGANMPKQYFPLLGQPIALYRSYGLLNGAAVLGVPFNDYNQREERTPYHLQEIGDESSEYKILQKLPLITLKSDSLLALEKNVMGDADPTGQAAIHDNAYSAYPFLQVIKPKLLREGLELVNREGLEVANDVSIVEHLKHPIYITEGSYTNIKVVDDALVLPPYGWNPLDLTKHVRKSIWAYEN